MTKERVKYMVQSIAIMAIATFLSFFLQSYGIRKENILMIYIVGVLVITVTTTGYLYGMMASVCSVLLFNYFFTVPVHTFAMTDQNDVVLLVFFLIAGFISASIMVRFHNQVRIAEETRAQMEREKLKSNMLRSISHDFRTPLTGIMGAAGLLKEADELDAGVRKELAGEIQEQSVWLMRLMENILNMTKLESEEFEIRKNQEVVDDLIYEAVSHIIGLREKRRFEIKLPSELIVVNVDGKLMVQVLVNLLDNAMKHTGENGWICIEARYDAGKVWISVEDDGDGIQEDLKENIFDEFVTRSDEKGDRQRGIGLGLAICKAVVNAHGGNICAENRKEGGAMFMFWLEARQEEEEKIQALDLGADDYVTKPFYMGELLARIRVALRKSNQIPEEKKEKIFQCDYLKVDWEKHQVSIDGKEVHLTPMEYKILKLLIDNRGKVLTHNYILGQIWGSAQGVEAANLRVFMAALRRKIEKDPGNCRFILTEVGVGYRFRETAE